MEISHDEMIERIRLLARKHACDGGLSKAEAPHVSYTSRELAQALYAALHALQGSSWQPIETAPKDWTHVLLWTEGVRVTEGYFDVAAQRFRPSHASELFYFTPTQWMPLPASPVVGHVRSTLDSEALSLTDER